MCNCTILNIRGGVCIHVKTNSMLTILKVICNGPNMLYDLLVAVVSHRLIFKLSYKKVFEISEVETLTVP